MFLGHSLGAGVAVLVALKLRPRYPHLKVFAFSTPGEHIIWIWNRLPNCSNKTCSQIITISKWKHNFTSIRVLSVWLLFGLVVTRATATLFLGLVSQSGRCYWVFFHYKFPPQNLHFYHKGPKTYLAKCGWPNSSGIKGGNKTCPLPLTISKWNHNLTSIGGQILIPFKKPTVSIINSQGTH